MSQVAYGLVKTNSEPGQDGLDFWTKVLEGAVVRDRNLSELQASAGRWRLHRSPDRPQPRRRGPRWGSSVVRPTRRRWPPARLPNCVGQPDRPIESLATSTNGIARSVPTTWNFPSL